MKKEKNNYLHHPFQLYNIESLRHDHGFSTGPCLFQYSEWTVIIEKWLLSIWPYSYYTVWKSHVLFTVYYSEPDLNNELFICWWVFLQCSPQRHLNALPTLKDSFSHHLCEMKSMISLYALCRRGGHDTEILKHLLNPSVQTEICKVKFHQNTYICHIIIDSFSRSQSRPLENKEHNHDPLKTFCF